MYKETQSSTDPTKLETHKKGIRAQRVIIDFMKDRPILHLAKKKIVRETYKALVDPFQSNNMNRKMILRNKLRSI